MGELKNGATQKLDAVARLPGINKTCVQLSANRSTTPISLTDGKTDDLPPGSTKSLLLRRITSLWR